MRCDIVTIFPEFFSVLDVSLLGKAKESGLLELHVKNLRDAASDRHKTVDDSPYGGGAGMVMKPEPWGVTLDAILDDTSPEPRAVRQETDFSQAPSEEPGYSRVLIIPTPSGQKFDQKMAKEFSEYSHIIFACGRYEGIDDRVSEHFSTKISVRRVSIGDYVVNGGEVAALVMLEAIARLIPGVIGNPESLVEESHENDLLEYPIFTRPERWRGLAVPPVLLSGNHEHIALWRKQQSIKRTVAHRVEGS